MSEKIRESHIHLIGEQNSTTAETGISKSYHCESWYYRTHKALSMQ